MSYRLIKGEFHIFSPDNPKQGPEPDGDTIKFKPDNPQLVELLVSDGHAPAFNKSQMVNIRFEGIDALELHFEGAFQNMEWALKARDFLLDRMGFGKVTFFQDPKLALKVEAVEHHPVPGYIVSYSLDTYGRVIAFVFAGDTDLPDGFQYFLKQEDIEKSINGQLLEDGDVYPTFYTTLPHDLTAFMRDKSKQVRGAMKGMWQFEDLNTQKSAVVPNLEKAESLIMWPKLFRRLTSYFNAGNTGLAGFDTWLRADTINRDDSVQLPNGEIGNMHDVIQIQGDAIQLLYEPEDLVILPDHSTPKPTPQPVPKTLKGDVRLVAAMVNPEGQDRGNEYVMVVNTTSKDILLDNWQLRDQRTDKQMLQGTLQAYEVKKVGLVQGFTLGNDGDVISLFDSQSLLVDEVHYTKEEGNKQGQLVVF